MASRSKKREEGMCDLRKEARPVVAALGRNQAADMGMSEVGLDLRAECSLEGETRYVLSGEVDILRIEMGEVRSMGGVIEGWDTRRNDFSIVLGILRKASIERGTSMAGMEGAKSRRSC